MTLFKTIVTWLGRATGIGYKSLGPLNEEPERRKQLLATKRMRRNAVSLTNEMDKLEKMLIDR